MKKIVTIASIVTFGFTSLMGGSKVECNHTPVGMELAKTLEAKEIDKAKQLLKKFKEEVKNYLAHCDNSEAKFEETSVMILTYEDRLADLEYDQKKVHKTVDCSLVPDAKALDNAFKEGDKKKINSTYEAYKDASEAYLDHCATHAEYEMVYESSLLHEEEYETWKKSL